ncbi:uncharacterized protein LOC133165054 [Syngnathus typhle]|uniref:uncharacterized protein LOC133165054 n=1 Tax=Syngnathus typhle TaxID=161592 RepID=UPI002A6AE9FC|nr:uncharacterized protein LOC133165054 [Syngnathus typhle]
MGAGTIAVLLGTVAFGISVGGYVETEIGTTVDVSLVMTLEEHFVDELNNRSSEQYKRLEAQVVAMCNFIYTKVYRTNFINTILIGFSPQMGNTRVEVVLNFCNASNDQIPPDDEVVNELVNVVNSTSNPFKFTVAPESIAVISTVSTTTQEPTSSLGSTPSANDSPTTQGATTAVPVAPPAVFVEAILLEPFVEELNNRSSQPFEQLEAQVVSAVRTSVQATSSYPHLLCTH